MATHQTQNSGPPSEWTPPQNRAIIAFRTDLEDALKANLRQKATSNLPKSHKTALKQLQDNTNIVIKPADKGSGIVILNKEDYKAEALRLLDDPNFYTKVDHDPSEEFHNTINQFLRQRVMTTGVIQYPQYQTLALYKLRTTTFYYLPKIHKNKNPPLGRPTLLNSTTNSMSKSKGQPWGHPSQ